jgi:hypothetical protein
MCDVALSVRATSHTRPRARGHYISSTLIGGRGKVGPSSLHTTLEGSTEYVILHGFLHGIQWIMFHGHLEYSQKLPLGGWPNRKPRDHGIPTTYKNQLKANGKGHEVLSRGRSSSHQGLCFGGHKVVWFHQMKLDLPHGAKCHSQGTRQSKLLHSSPKR